MAVSNQPLFVASMIAALSVGLLAGCSDDNDNDNNDDASGGGTAPAPDAEALTAGDLEGFWSTGCVLDDTDNGQAEYEIATVRFADNNTFVASATSFSDSGCTQSVVDDDDIELSGTLELGGAVTTSDGMTATEADFIATPPGSPDSPSRTLPDLVAINGDTLFLGEGDFNDINDSGTDARPDSLDLDDPYQRQNDAAGNSDNTGSTMTPAPDTEALSAGDLDGAWSTGCVLEDQDDGQAEYEIATVTFTDNIFSASVASFSDSGCTQSVVDDDDIELSGTLELGGAVTTSDGMTATEADFIATPPGSPDSPSRTLPDLVAINGDTLFLGEGDFNDINDSDTDARPDSLDLDDPYQRQP